MRLKVQYEATEEGDEVTWNPENFHIWLNGMELDLVKQLSIMIPGDGTEPSMQIVFTPNEIDIDADTILALQALLDNAEEIPDSELIEEAKRDMPEKLDE